MIIAIHGKKNSGKDTVAKMIQELYPEKFKIVKFAGILKDLVSKITNCSVDQLEDPDFKETTLPEQFYKYEVYIKGYSTFDDKLIEIYNNSEDANRVKNQNIYNRFIKIVKPTYRDLLIAIGTALRNVDQNIFVHILLNSLNSNDNYIITDLRFQNELTALKKYHPETIFVSVERLQIGDEVIFNVGNSSNTTAVGVVTEIQSQNNICILGPDQKEYWKNVLEFHLPSVGHQSEIDLDDYDDWDYTIYNYTSKKELKRKIINFSLIHKLNKILK